MLKEKRIEQLRKKNDRLLRELFGFSYALGINLGAPSRLGDSLKILNVILLITNIISMYGHWAFVEHFADDIPMIADSITVAFQSVISMVKMIYCLFMQHKFAKLLSMLKSHYWLSKIEVLQWDTPPLRHKLDQEINAVMDSVWRNTRRQLIVYMVLIVCSMANYICGPLFVNLYHYLRETPNYVHILPGSAFYPCWQDKGMSFPYYPIQVFIHSCSIHICAMGAISFEGIFTALCLHGTGLVRVLKAMIQLATSPIVPKNRRTEYLRCCIYQYQRTEEYLLQIGQLFKHISLSQIMLSLFIFGLALFQASTNLSNMRILFRMVTYIVAAFYGIVIYCYNGQRLTDATEDLPLAFYSCAWYDESKEFKQLVQMMILRTNRTFRLDISWFSTMSVATLLFIVQTSSSYFLLIRNVTEDNRE